MDVRGHDTATLEARLRAAAAALVQVLEGIEPERWKRLPDPPAWSIGKDAAHVAEAAVYHQWIIQLTIGEPVSSRRPAIERKERATALTVREAIDLILVRTDDSAALIAALTGEQLALLTRPPRAGAATLAETIERVMVGHYEQHRREIARKLREAP